MYRQALSITIGLVVGLGAPVALEAQCRPAARDGNVLLEGQALPWQAGGQSGMQMAPLYGNAGEAGKPFTFRLRVPDGFEMGPHTHPVAEHMTVLSGRFFVGIGTKLDRSAAKEYGPGSYVVVAAGVPAYMWAVGETVVQVHGIGPLTSQPVGQE